MSATLAYRIASILLVIFAAGHSYGFLKFKPSTPEAVAVRAGMDKVRFLLGGSEASYGGFYTGFGLTITVYLLFCAFLAWHLGAIAHDHAGAIGILGWVFVLVQFIVLVLSWIYFSAPPVILSALITACLAWAAWLAQTGMPRA